MLAFPTVVDRGAFTSTMPAPVVTCRSLA